MSRRLGMTRSRTSRLSALSFTMAATAALAGGCAGQSDVDRTQPDKIDKSIFFDTGGQPKVWYYRETTVDAPPETNWAFEGIQSVPGELGSTLEKIRFVILENQLVAYRAYDYAPGSQNDFTSGL